MKLSLVSENRKYFITNHLYFPSQESAAAGKVQFTSLGTNEKEIEGRGICRL